MRRLEGVLGHTRVVSSSLTSAAEDKALAEKKLVALQLQRKKLEAEILSVQEQLGQPTALQRYQFDKDGYIVIKGALSGKEVAACCTCLDTIPWAPEIVSGGGVWKDGLNLQQIYEAGLPFEALIDHPSWIEKVKTFVGGQGTFDSTWGPLFIDENFANFRGPGEAIGLHSGGEPLLKRNQYTFKNGQFGAYQVNVLVALTDIGPGDGGTMLLPGSHKANFEHPWVAEQAHKYMRGDKGSLRDVNGVPGAVEVFMKKGDALVFSDATAHGSARRENDGFRKICVYRYQPSWSNFRIPYAPSEELKARLTPEQRKIVAPTWMDTLKKEPQRKPNY